MQAPLAAPDPFEVLHRIGDVNFVAGNERVFQRPVEDAAGRPDEWFTFLVFNVTGLLANQHHIRVARPLAKNGLGGIAVEIASLAVLSRLSKSIQANVSRARNHQPMSSQSFSLPWSDRITCKL